MERDAFAVSLYQDNLVALVVDEDHCSLHDFVVSFATKTCSMNHIIIHASADYSRLGEIRIRD